LNINVNDAALDKLSNEWSFKLEERKNMQGIAEKFKTILHKGTIRMKDDYSYASWITLKNADFANGIIRFNLKIVDQNPFNILFRYTDGENHYGIGITIKNRTSNINLFTKISSSYNVVESKYLKMLRPEVWLRCTLIMNNEDVQFLIQQEGVRENKLVFAKKMPELPRGTVGFGTNGNSLFYVSGFKIEEYKPNQEKKALNNTNKTRSFEGIMKNSGMKEIKKFCKVIFKKGTTEYDKCLQPHNFCLAKCDSLVPALQERLLNFKCSKSCVKTVYEVNASILRDNLPKPTKFDPKPTDKVDFLVNGEVYYRPGIVKTISNKKNQKLVRIEYHSKENGEMQFSDVMMDDKNIAKCGEKLPHRVDCNENHN
jgi:hypothetical protein